MILHGVRGTSTCVIFVCACNTARAPSFCTRDTSDARHPAREGSRTASIRALRYVPRGGSALSRSAISGIHRNIRARVSSALRKKSRCRNSYRFDTSSLTPRCASFCATSRFAWRHLLPRMIASNSFSALRQLGQTVWPFGSNFAPHLTQMPCSRPSLRFCRAHRARSFWSSFILIHL